MADLVQPITLDDKEVEGVHAETVGDSASTQDNGEVYVVDKHLEQKLLRKFDFFILPLVALMYFFKYDDVKILFCEEIMSLTKVISSIDKSNLSNAKTDKLENDLHFHGNQYNILLSIFYIPFVLSGPPMNMLTKRFGAKYVLLSAMLIFGSMAMISAATTNFGGIVTTRWFLGMAESGFYPGVIFYLTTFYKRRELASRAESVLCRFSNRGGVHGTTRIRRLSDPWTYLWLAISVPHRR